MHDGILLGHQKERTNAICNNTDDPQDCHTELSKSEKEDKHHLRSHICGVCRQRKQTHRHGEETCGCQWGWAG